MCTNAGDPGGVEYFTGVKRPSKTVEGHSKTSPNCNLNHSQLITSDQRGRSIQQEGLVLLVQVAVSGTSDQSQSFEK